MDASDSVSDLIAFLRARLDEDEQVVQRAPVDQAPNDLRALVDRAGGEPFLVINPSRVLAEVEAKRQIIDECAHEVDRATEESPEGDLASFVLRTLPLSYADHPDYRPEWAPAG